MNKHPFEPLIKKNKQLGVVVHACNPSYLAGQSRMISNLKPVWAAKQDFI
jgi:hypothetical protein